MPKIWVENFRRLAAVSVFTFGTLSFICAAGVSWAEEAVPIPSHKPVPALKGDVIKYSLDDFSKALLDYGAPSVPKPKPFFIGEGSLSEEDAFRYRNIFALQASGDVRAANAELLKLKDMRLRGHVLYQRYMHPTAYVSRFDELQNWLVLYADHPNAHKIYKLAVHKRPADFRGSLNKPEKVKGVARMREPMMVAARSYRSSKKRNKEQRDQVKKLKRSIYSLVNRTRPTQAYKTLEESESAQFLDKVEYDLLRSQIAVGYLHAGKTTKAYELAMASVKRSGKHVPVAGWVAGLVSWKKKDYRKAAKFFEIPASSSYASSWTTAAGSYWAARAHMRAGSVKAVRTWLERAKEHPRTFYGLIATRALGDNFKFNWEFPSYIDEHQSVLEKAPAAQRAMALVAAGQTHLAEAELLRLDRDNEDLQEALLAYAGHAGLPALAMRLGHTVASPEGNYYDAALYPQVPWELKGEYSALVHAIMRQESRFNPMAESPSGAIGLMQLMPRTASYVAGSRTLRSKEGQHKLMEPEINLEIGQQYLEHLLAGRHVDGDLLQLLIAYNAGPGNLSRWKKQWANVDDPLLFIEIMPSRETRAYIERVLANYWIYRLREGLPTPTLDALAKGKPAQYADAINSIPKTPRGQRPSVPYKVAFNE